ncbi:MAG TPA: FAD-dependent monooxygenase [Jiangellaceae bacterium]|nr:FAD-dependent monooxygenase [Jiangellaceae bacterium]
MFGDAAHAMMPDLGQGAGQAIEDAVTLAAAVSSHQVVSTALSIYNRGVPLTPVGFRGTR